MRPLLALTLLLALVSTTTAADVPRVFPYRSEKHTLPNGLTAILIPMESPGLVAYYSVVAPAVATKSGEQSGFAHFFEHMMFRGTKKYPADVYEAILTKLGSSHNAYTTDDLTAYHLKFAKEDARQSSISATGSKSPLQRTGFQTEAGAVYGEYRKNILAVFALEREDQDRLRRAPTSTTMGFERDIRAMPRQFGTAGRSSTVSTARECRARHRR